MFITTQSIIDETGLDLAKFKDYFSTGDELSRVLKENKLNCETHLAWSGLQAPYNILSNSGLPWIDYENDIASIDIPETKKVYIMLKDSFYKYLINKDVRLHHSPSSNANWINEKKTMFVEIDRPQKFTISSKALTMY